MVGTLTNQIPASSVHKARKARKARKACTARKARIRRVRRVRCIRRVRRWGKYQDFMLIRLFNSIDLIGCGGDINQSDSCKQCA